MLPLACQGHETSRRDMAIVSHPNFHRVCVTPSGKQNTMRGFSINQPDYSNFENVYLQGMSFFGENCSLSVF